ncbi:MAG: galactitol-1-phosphate 5-dehydrogenase [Pseudomonadota bacterium]|nr:galactitol-1-phosphate 5-dehydrogenase [Pseudomonadota bacterium]
MKALVYTEPNCMRLQDRDPPEVAPGDVVVQIDAVGICGSDLHAFHGHDPRRKPGLVLGHEFAGTVLASADAAWAVGRRVTGNPLITCGRCDYCLQGRDNLCSHRTMVGMTRPGAFAERMGIPGRCLIEIPDALDPVAAALTEPAATALHAVNLSARAMARPIHEGRVLVIGGGAIGMLSALLLRHLGAEQVQVGEVNPLRRNSIEQHARCATFDPRNASADDSAFELVIDAVGSAITRQAALAAVRPGGVVMHIGLQDWASEIDMRKLTLAEITLLGTYTYSMADLRATVALLGRGAFGDLAWVERRPLAQGAQAFDDLHHGRLASAKVVLQPRPQAETAS